MTTSFILAIEKKNIHIELNQTFSLSGRVSYFMEHPKSVQTKRVFPRTVPMLMWISNDVILTITTTQAFHGNFFEDDLPCVVVIFHRTYLKHKKQGKNNKKLPQILT